MPILVVLCRCRCQVVSICIRHSEVCQTLTFREEAYLYITTLVLVAAGQRERID